LSWRFPLLTRRWNGASILTAETLEKRGCLAQSPRKAEPRTVGNRYRLKFPNLFSTCMQNWLHTRTESKERRMTEHIESLKRLHTILIDSKHGYEDALADAEGHGMTQVFRDMIALRIKDGGEIATELATLGEKADDKGSFMTTVNRAIISLRSLFGGLDESILPGLIDAEKRIVSNYDSALESAASTVDREILTRQRQNLLKIIADMESKNALAA